jgi:hypothetical protein
MGEWVGRYLRPQLRHLAEELVERLVGRAGVEPDGEHLFSEEQPRAHALLRSVRAHDAVHGGAEAVERPALVPLVARPALLGRRQVRHRHARHVLELLPAAVLLPGPVRPYVVARPLLLHRQRPRVGLARHLRQAPLRVLGRAVAEESPVGRELVRCHSPALAALRRRREEGRPHRDQPLVDALARQVLPLARLLHPHDGQQRERGQHVGPPARAHGAVQHPAALLRRRTLEAHDGRVRAVPASARA